MLEELETDFSLGLTTYELTRSSAYVRRDDVLDSIDKLLKKPVAITGDVRACDVQRYVDIVRIWQVVDRANLL